LALRPRSNSPECPDDKNRKKNQKPAHRVPSIPGIVNGRVEKTERQLGSRGGREAGKRRVLKKLTGRYPDSKRHHAHRQVALMLATYLGSSFSLSPISCFGLPKLSS
jgi:hypothetical protein